MMESNQPAQPEISERRLMTRYPSRSSVTVIRDSDRMRTGIFGKLKDISVAGLAFNLPTALEVGEHIKLELRNEIQRVKKEAGGIVRHVAMREDGSFHIGVELRARLNPLDVSLLKMSMPIGEQAAQSSWL